MLAMWSFGVRTHLHPPSVFRDRLPGRTTLLTILLASAAALHGTAQAQDNPAPQALPPLLVVSPETGMTPVEQRRQRIERATEGVRAQRDRRVKNDPDAVDTPIELDPITVTARRRDENAQTVPISVTVVPDAGATVAPSVSNASLARAVPNMAFFDGGGIYGNTFSIRGIGSISPLV
jgi:iron complex outermembrane recepter protein